MKMSRIVNFCRVVTGTMLAAGVAAGAAAPAAPKDPEELRARVDAGWANCMATYWSPKTALVYGCTPDKVRPAREFDDGPGFFKWRKDVPGKNTYGKGMGDCSLIGGVALSGIIDRWLVTQDAATAETAAKVARGMLNLAVLHGYRGFVARGVCEEDGRSICALSSRDQYTHWVHSLHRYCASGLAAPAFKAAFAREMANVAWLMETRCTPERNWNFGLVDGSADPRGICTMWGPDLSPHEQARLPMIYLAAFDVTGDRRWKDLYEKYIDEALDRSQGMADPKETRRMPCYSLLQAITSFELIAGIETAPARLAKLRSAMQATAKAAHDRAMIELADRSRRFYGMCDDGELALTQLMCPDAPVTADDRRFLDLIVTRDDLLKAGTCRNAHVYAAVWRAARRDRPRPEPRATPDRPTCR